MRVAVMGGRLQGVEAVYLAKKAGWQTLLVDLNPQAPACGICDCYFKLDFTREKELTELFKGVDIIIPAVENKEVLSCIAKSAKAAGTRLIYDTAAYELSSSKLESDKLFARLGVPAPKPWPECRFPVTVKPSGASGSEGVHRIEGQKQLGALKSELGKFDDWVIQEYLEGPSYSIEVIGSKGVYKALQVTELEMDAKYDCKRVLAPSGLSPEMTKEFEAIAVTLAGELSLEGIMDVEVILHEGQLKVLEIDARLPSQTPTAVYHSTGVNMLELLGLGLSEGCIKEKIGENNPRGVVYEHIKVNSKAVEVCGEHIMADAGRLLIVNGFFGADEAITNYSIGKQEWVATLIITGPDRLSALQKRQDVIKRIMKEFNISGFRDPVPEGFAGEEVIL